MLLIKKCILIFRGEIVAWQWWVPLFEGPTFTQNIFWPLTKSSEIKSMQISCTTSQKEGIDRALVNFMIYAVLSQQACRNLSVFFLPSTWSSSISPSSSLPLKPILILCHPLVISKLFLAALSSSRSLDVCRSVRPSVMFVKKWPL